MSKQLVQKLRASRKQAYLKRPRNIIQPNLDVAREYGRRARSNEDSESELDQIIRILKKMGVEVPRSALRAGEPKEGTAFSLKTTPRDEIVSNDRPMHDGLPGCLQCSCGKGPFWTNTKWQLHLKTITKGELDNHLSSFIPSTISVSDTQNIKEAEEVSVKQAFQHGVYAMWQGWKRQGLTEFNCVKAKEVSQDVTIYWFFGGNAHFFAEEDKGNLSVRMSMVYGDRARAFRDMERNRIYWVKTFTIPGPP